MVAALPVLYQLGARASVPEQPVWPSRSMWFETAAMVFCVAHMLSVLTDVVVPAMMFLLASIVCVGMAFASMTWVTMYVLESCRAERMEVDQVLGHVAAPAAPVFVQGEGIAGTIGEAVRDAQVMIPATLDPKKPSTMDADHWVTMRRNVVLDGAPRDAISAEMDLAVVNSDAVKGLSRLSQADKAVIAGISGVQDVLTVELQYENPEMVVDKYVHDKVLVPALVERALAQQRLMDAGLLPANCHHMSMERMEIPSRGPHLVCRFRDGSSGNVVAQMCMREQQAGALMSFLAPSAREVVSDDEMDVDDPKGKGPATSAMVVESKGKRYASYWRSGGQGN